MELVLRSAAVLLLSALTALILKKNAPELALMLSFVALCTVFLSLLDTVRQFVRFSIRSLSCSRTPR